MQPTKIALRSDNKVSGDLLRSAPKSKMPAAASSSDDGTSSHASLRGPDEGGSAQIPLGATFCVECFGMVTDRYGTAGAVNGGTPKMGLG